MKIFCIDPGTTKSAYVLFETTTQDIIAFGIEDNDQLVKKLHGDRLVIEMIKSYGNVMGDSILQTCVWIGRFIQEWGADSFDLVPRKTIVASLCMNPRAKDSNVRQALIDLFGAPGTKKLPGKTYGIKKDIWSALAVAAVYEELFDK